MQQMQKWYKMCSLPPPPSFSYIPKKSAKLILVWFYIEKLSLV